MSGCGGLALFIMLPKQGRFALLVEDGLQNECFKCGRNSTQFELVVTENGKENFHLKCYNAPDFFHLDEGVVTPRLAYPENARKFKAWMAAHNSKLHFPLPLPKPVLQATPLPAVSLAYRYLEPRDIVTAGSVNRQWYSSTWMDEVWGRPKSELMTQKHSACLNCGKVVREDTLGLLWLGRPLCRLCRATEDMQVVRVDTLCRSLGIEPRACRTDMPQSTPQIGGHSVVFWAEGVKKSSKCDDKDEITWPRY